MQRHSLLALAGLMLGLVVACPSPPQPLTDAGALQELDGGPTTVDDDAGIDAGIPDAGPVDAGFFCSSDLQCEQFKKGLRCDTIDGRCIAATGCQFDSNCQSSDPDDYCFEGDVQCRCITTDSRPDSGLPGICQRRKKVCEECTADVECGNTGVFNPVGACKALPTDTSGKKYCLRAKVGSTCKAGMVDDGTGFCKPQNNNCSSFGCAEDKDCDPGSACNTRTGLCERRCRWDFTAKESVPGCGNENSKAKVCWVDSDSLNPASPSYGSGRCKLPCAQDSDCLKSDVNPQGGENLKCAGEKQKDGTVTAKRCRAKGDCMDRLECPANPSSQPELGYCDLAKFACFSDCRLGKDPVTQAPFADCQSSHQCAPGPVAGGPNVCRKQPCAEAGGTKACAQGQLCCGEDRNGDGVAEPCPAGVAFEANKCYDPPRPPYCTVCASNADCTKFPGMGGRDGGTPLPSLCLDNINGFALPAAVCQLSTVNDFTLQADGQTAAKRGCPAQYEVNLGPVPTAGAVEFDMCTTDADCRAGHDAGVGKCGSDPRRKLPDAGTVKSCLCDNSTKAWVCPRVPGETFFSICPALPGPQACAQSVTCAPTAGQLAAPSGAPSYGCGLGE
ncbi:MAG: hypothetical protein ACT4TC_19720 [Myxococcaceae bacterium]